MRISTTTARKIALFASATAAASAWGTPAADADSTQTDLGSPAQLGSGSDAQRWTVANLRPSSDPIPYQPTGTVWEATATGQFVGGGIPVVPGFSARAGADYYPVVWGVASPEGINPGSLPPGGSTTGKLYFDVTGAVPSSVVYTADGQDLAVWLLALPPAAASPGVDIGPSAAAPTPGSTSAALPPRTGPASPRPITRR